MKWKLKVWLMMCNATFNNISVISWRSVLLIAETGVPGENHRHITHKTKGRVTQTQLKEDPKVLKRGSLLLAFALKKGKYFL
jgi:hypothetical protein